MPASQPTILATSGGIRAGARTPWEFSPLTDLAIDLAEVDGRAPKVCFLATACGDDAGLIRTFYAAAQARGYQASHLQLFAMPNIENMTDHLLDQDVIWVFGGSVAGLLAMWRLHGLDASMRAAWEAGVVLTGVSAGSICWHAGGPTDSFGPELRCVDDGLGFLPYANGVHYDTEERRRPAFHSSIAEGRLPDGYATDDGVGLLYRGTELVEAVTEIRGKGAYRVVRDGDGVTEERLDVRLLPGAAGRGPR